MRASPKGTRPRSLPSGVQIVHEDDDLIVIDKPAGLLTAGMPGQEIDSAFSFLKGYIKDQHRRRGTKVWIIHRLDKEASGLLVFAKSERAFEFLKEEFRAKRPHRLYAAVVEGEIAPEASKTRETPAGQKRIAQPASGTTQSYLLEDEKGIVKSFKNAADAIRVQKLPGFRASDGEGKGDHPKLAVTHWRVMEAALGRSLLQVRLETGRKNQIRVHMRDIQHPIVGDRRYDAATDPIGRVCLHAAELGFTHPANGKSLRFRSDIPGGFFSLVGKSKGDATAGDAAPALQKPAAPSPVKPAPQATQPPPRSHATDSWDHVADWYSELLDERRSDHHEQVILPGAARLLNLAGGQSLLDVACGQGVLCHRLVASGINCTGIDTSPRLIDAAQKSASSGENFLVGDARTIGSLDLGGAFDAVACIMALMNIDPLAPVLQGVADRLKPLGSFVCVILHPAFRAPGQTGWGWDEGTPVPGAKKHQKPPAPRQYRRVDGYLSPAAAPIVMNPGAAAKGVAPVTTVTFHRPIQSYIKALAEAGLVVDAIEEWPSIRTSQPGPRAAEENRARREIPMFLAIRARKVPSDGQPG